MYDQNAQSKKRKNLLLKLFALLICISLLSPQTILAAPVTDDGPTGAEESQGVTGDSQINVVYPARTVIVHLWEWKWTDVAKECEMVLGPKGYAAVQVSPPNDHAWAQTGGVYPWWLRYQPVSYQINSRSGTLAEFQDMVNRCYAVGVQIYVDAVVNHMTGVSGSPVGVVGYNGASYDPFYSANDPNNNTDPANYLSWANGLHFPNLGPGNQMCGGVACGFGPSDFHYCGTNPGGGGTTPNNIPDSAYNNDAWQVRNCELVNLSDLKTDNNYVRERLAAYLDYLVSIGVGGFRIDAAKHMEPADIQAIIAMVDNRPAAFGGGAPYFYQEVIDRNGTEQITKWQYNAIADVKEFKAEGDMSYIFRNSTIKSFLTPTAFGEAWSLLPSDQAVTFVVNHDDIHHPETYLTYKDTAKYKLANVFMLAYPYGYPKVMSSYDFPTGSFDETPPSDAAGHTSNVWNADNTSNCPADSAINPNNWVCEHRWKAIAGMVGFKDFTQSFWGVTNTWNNGSNQIAFGRNDRGFVVINNEGAALTRVFQTNMAAGIYCDVIHGELTSDGKGCTGTRIIVDANKRAYLSVPANDAVAFHVGAKITHFSPSAQAAVNVNAGDNNGFQTNPTRVYYDDSTYATDASSGTNTSTSCTSIAKDKHNFYNFNIPTISPAATISSIIVRLDAKVSSVAPATRRMCVQLSWDGGTNWTACQQTANMTTGELTYTLSGLWGRAWTAGELTNANFRVRVIDVASVTSVTFSLDYVGVQVTLANPAP